MSDNTNKLKQTKYVFLIGFALLGLVIILTTTLPNSFQYYVTVSEFTHDHQKYDHKQIKLAGKVVPGSIKHQGTTWNFDVFHEEATLPVVYQGAMPDTFNDTAEVVLTGTYEGQSFIATHVLAKCASKYEEKLQPPLQSQKDKA